MPAIFIATTKRGDFNAMRHQGILVTNSYAQIASMLEKNLSSAHALFFAEPAHDASGATTDWYTGATGSPVPLANLPEEEQNAARERIKALASDIDKFAQSLKQDENSSKNIRGNILALALSYPGTEHIYMVGAQPVLTCWGFAPGTVGAQPEDLMRLGAVLPKVGTPAQATTAAAAPAPVVATGTFRWWRGLLFFLLGLLLLVPLFFLAGLLFSPNGCVGPDMLPNGCVGPETFPKGCVGPDMLPKGCQASFSGCSQIEDKEPEPAEPEPVKPDLLGEELDKEASLHRDLDDLRRQLDARAKLCQPSPPKKPEKEQESAPQEPPSLAELMPLTPDPVETPEPTPPEKKKAPPQKPKAEKQKKGEDMRIPENAKKNKDVSFLEGCWDSDPGLTSAKTGEPIDVQYCFDANGNGSRTIKLSKSKDRCSGSVRARFDALGNLNINSDGAPCGKGNSFVPQDVQCSQTGDGKASCYGQERGGKRNKWNARFRRS